MFRRILLLALLAGAALSRLLLAQEDEHTKKLSEGKGRDLVATVCRQCHGLDTITDSRHSLDEWKNIVNDMVNDGAALNQEQAEAVSQYLAKNFGPQSDKSKDAKDGKQGKR